ncbi:hypothetical protein C8Q80DRAFT_612038 [Daedaleopsis nitida]|nr:hypothetical protein C8Q80DRAFT_612038 [Daedaleopsis nitida]
MIVKESRRLFQTHPTRVNTRSIELAGAYLLMALYDGDCTGAGRDQRLNVMIATRIVSELPPALNERQKVNAERLWLWCYILDRSNAIGFGRKPDIIEDDFIRNSATWYKRSIFNTVTDIKISAHVELLRILSQFSEMIHTGRSRSSVRKDSDIQLVVDDYLQRLDDFGVEWQRRFADDGDLMNPAIAFDRSLISLLMDYSRLIVSSTASLQYPSHTPHHHRFASQYAKRMITTMVDSLAPTGFVQTSPSMVFMYTTVAATYLAKLTSEGFIPLTEEVINMLDTLVLCFSSPQVALDESHIPAVHARRLAEITDQLKIRRPPLSGGARPGGTSSERKSGPSAKPFFAPTTGCLSES